MKSFLQVLVFVVVVVVAGIDSFLSLPTPGSVDNHAPWRLENAGLFKEARVVSMGHSADTVILLTERGELEVRAALAIGSEWINVVVTPEGEVVRRTLHKGVARACIKAVRITPAGERVIGNQAIEDAFGNPNGTYETVECRK